MAFVPIPENTDPWFDQANDAWTDQDNRITTLEGARGGTYFYTVAAGSAPANQQAKANYVCDGIADQIEIQAAIDAANAASGGIVQLTQGQYNISAPITLHPRVTLRGVHGDQIFNPTQLTLSSRLNIVAEFVGGAAIVMLGQTAGGYGGKSAEQQIMDLTIDGANSPAAVHGIQASDYIHGALLERVAVKQVTGKGIYTFTENGAQPFSWTMRHVIVDNSAGVGIHLINHTDFTGYDVISIGAGSDNFVLSNMPNSRMVACRAEWGEGHGYKIEGNWGTGSGSGGMTFTGCSTDRNHSNGFDITSTGNGPISIVGCFTRRDGRNNNSGGGGFAGIFAAGATTPIVISGWTQYPGQDDNGTGVNSPQIGGSFNGNACVQIDTCYVHANTTGIVQATNTIYQAGNMVTATGDTTAPVRTATP